jgi:hypothetical protein
MKPAKRIQGKWSSGDPADEFTVHAPLLTNGTRITRGSSWRLQPPALASISTTTSFPTLRRTTMNSGSGFPVWAPEYSLSAMDDLGIERTILSMPGNPGGGRDSANRKFARLLNHVAFRASEKYPDRFGFFANLPLSADADPAMTEMRYAFATGHSQDEDGGNKKTRNHPGRAHAALQPANTNNLFLLPETLGPELT